MLADAIIQASAKITSILDTKAGQGRQCQSPWFELLHWAYGDIKLAVREARETRRTEELAAMLRHWGYTKPVGRACSLFGVSEDY